MKFFISYSHKDKAFVEKLHAHLSVLRRDGRVSTWYDREIDVGKELDREIETHLADSDVFLALVSSDYINSDYCFDKEFRIALERHENGTMTVVPIILRPCAWTRTPLGKLKAAPDDDKPIAEWPNEDRAYTDVIDELFRIVDKRSVAITDTLQPPAKTAMPENRRYRGKREFDDIEKQEFRQDAFNTIVRLFESELGILIAHERLKGKLSKIGEDGFTCTVVNKAVRRGAAHLTVYAGHDGRLADIYYSTAERPDRDTANGMFFIESDGYDLYLKPSLFRHDHSDLIPAEDVAHFLWDELLERAEIEHA